SSRHSRPGRPTCSSHSSAPRARPAGDCSPIAPCPACSRKTGPARWRSGKSTSASLGASDGRLRRAPAPSIFHEHPVSEPTEPQPVRYERVSVVEPGDIDDLGHVNNVVYLRWVQDVAAAHWEATIAPEERVDVAWVVLRHEIDYQHPAVLGDQVVARTWVGT